MFCWKYLIIFAAYLYYSDCYEIHLKNPRLFDEDSLYRLDSNKLYSKIAQRSGRILKKTKIELSITGLESSFSWSELLFGEKRLAVGFHLLQGKKYAENVVLYTPRDFSYRVHGLKDNTEYSGSVRLIRDRYEIQQSNSSTDNYQFKFDSPRMIQGREEMYHVNEIKRELYKFQEYISQLKNFKIKLDSSSVTFKLPNRIRNHYILEVHNLNESSVISKTEIHVVPNSKTIILNDLPGNTIMKMVMRRLNATSAGDDVSVSYLFTGSLKADDQRTDMPSSITRIFIYNKHRLDFNQQNATTDKSEEKTVPCHVLNRRPFDGFPCPQSQVCLPLHWRCDGQQDCPGGLDEDGCENYSFRDESLPSPKGSHCKAEEASCSHKNATLCLPNTWLCDGRQDCPDGWDEKPENCPPKITTYTLPSLKQGIRRITNLLWRCRGSYFRCRSGECISDRSLCDGINHCDDASDELYCDDEEKDEEDYDPEFEPDYDFECHPRYEFRCYKSYSHKSRRCIPKAWLCDAFQDCPYGEDENTNFCSHQHLFQGYFK